MPAVTRQGDGCTGHGAYPPRKSVSGSPDVMINGAPAHREGDAWESHCNPDGVCHDSTLAAGSGSVMVNGKPLGRVGDPIDCGSAVAAGSPDVLAGG